MAVEFNNNDVDGRDIRQALDRWRDSVHSQSDRPGWFWARQRARISSGIKELRRPSIPALAWASLAATIAIAVSLILPARPEKTVQPVPRAQNQAQISDHDLMVAIERSMNAGVPSSLAPASLLADEMNQAFETQVQSQKAKESRYEN
jgi:hypothetical protein